MSRIEAIAQINSALTHLSDERVQSLADIAQSWAEDMARPPEDDATRAAIAEGIAQAERGEFATEAEVAALYARVRK